MGQKQAVRSNLRQSRRRRTNVSQVAVQRTRSQHKSLSPFLLFKRSLKLFQRHTGVLWLVVGALLVGTTAAAVMTIMDPTASVLPQSSISQSSSPQIPIEPEQPAVIDRSGSSSNGSAVERRQPDPEPVLPVESRSAQPASPLSAGSMLLLSCAGGCFLLSQWLKPQPAAKRLVDSRARTIRPKTARSAQTITGSDKTLPTIADHSSGLSQPPKRPPVLASEVSRLKDTLPEQCEGEQAGDRTILEPVPESEPATEVTVTVMPNGEIHPLDWDEPSLADNLDLRQQRPLSYWL